MIKEILKLANSLIRILLLTDHKLMYTAAMKWVLREKQV